MTTLANQGDRDTFLQFQVVLPSDAIGDRLLHHWHWKDPSAWKEATLALSSYLQAKLTFRNDKVAEAHRVLRDAVCDLNQYAVFYPSEGDPAKLIGRVRESYKNFVEVASHEIEDAYSGKVGIIIDEKNAEVRREDGIGDVYPLKKSERRSKIILTIATSPRVKASQLSNRNSKHPVQDVSKEIRRMNKQFREKLLIDEDLITNPGRGGYGLNRQAFNVRRA